MKRLLLLLGAAALLVAAPVSAQYIYLDTNGDGICNTSDLLSPSTTAIDIYFDTSHDALGNLIACPQGDGVNPNMFSYEFILHTTGVGSVTFGTYTELSGFATNLIGPGTASGDFWAGYGSATALPASGNPYKVGSVAVTVTQNPVVDFAVSTSGELNAFTVFGSECLSPSFDYTWVWLTDWSDACGTAPTTDVRPTTWGQIKNLYK